MNIITVLIVGLLSGYMASHLVDGRGFGALGDICLGVLGAVVGGFLFSSFGGVSYTFVGSVLTATAGAAVLLVLAHTLTGRTRLAAVKR